MPAPSSSLATLRPDLASSLEEFDLQADRAGFIGLRVAPVIEVAQSAGVFGKIPLEQLLLNKDTQRAPGSAYARGSWTFSTATFATQEHGWEEVVDDREAKNYREYFDAEQISAARARDFVLRNYERRIAAAVFDATTYAAQLTNVTTEWSTVATATPITDVNTACVTIWERCGLWPNAIVMGRKVFRNARQCSQIIDKVSSVQGVLPADVGVAELSAAFDLPYVFVGGGAQNTANEGQAAAISGIWDDEYVAVIRVPTTSDPREPCLIRTFHWGADGSSIGTTFETYRDESRRGEVVRARMDTDEVTMYSDCIQLLGNITA